MLRKILAFKLRLIAKAILKKYRPKIVAITGSVGKSSTKEAIFTVLSKHFKVRKNEANFNTEIGVPMTVVGENYVGGNIWRWKQILFKGLAMLFKKTDYPEILILEMGADRPGDIRYLTSFIKPDVSVITNIGVSHLEFFKDVQELRNEKAAIIRALPENGLAVLNGDDEGTMSVKNQTKARAVLYNLPPDEHGNAPYAYARLAAVAVAKFFGISREQALDDLKEFKNLRGRLVELPGVNGSTIIDDTYNSAPASAIAAIKYLKNREGKRKIAVLGRMAELGAATESGHVEVGRVAAKQDLDLLLVKNNDASLIARGAREAGMPKEKIKEFGSAEEVANLIQLSPGDVVLVKASQAEYFEDIIKGIMAEPARANQLLVQRDYTRR